jgi:O-methyltransferase
MELTRVHAVPKELYEEGRGRPEELLSIGETMIGRKRLDNVHHCVDEVLENNIPGDLIEAGVWRGGVTILMRAILKTKGIGDRQVWAADSFQGLPPVNMSEYPQDTEVGLQGVEAFTVSLDEVRANFARYGLLDEQVQFIEGWFRETLPRLEDRKWAVIRLDGDLYESTMDGLKHLYPNLSVGGLVIVDDYGAFRPCRQAVHDYRDAHDIQEPIIPIDWTGVYWRREREGLPKP